MGNCVLLTISCAACSPVEVSEVSRQERTKRLTGLQHVAQMCTNVSYAATWSPEEDVPLR